MEAAKSKKGCNLRLSIIGAFVGLSCDKDFCMAILLPSIIWLFLQVNKIVSFIIMHYVVVTRTVKFYLEVKLIVGLLAGC